VRNDIFEFMANPHYCQKIIFQTSNRFMDETININGGKTIIIYHPMQGIDSYLPETKKCLYGIQCHSYSVHTICGACNVIFHDKCFVLKLVRARCGAVGWGR
jgi:hypothetical protein